MEESRWILLAGLEFGLLLFIACLFLLFHVRSLRMLVAALEAKVMSLRKVLRVSRSEARETRSELAAMRRDSRDFAGHLEQQIAATRERHLGLQPDRDIVLDIAADAPRERQALALRHALLIAEKAAWEASDDDGFAWAVLDTRLGAIIDFYQRRGPAPAADTVAAVGDAKSTAAVANGATASGSPTGDGGVELPVVALQRVIVNQDEVNRLRNMAVDQHKVILQLKKQLAEAQSIEQKDAAIAELQTQLDRQARFLQESDTCIRLLEEELQRALESQHQQQTPGDSADVQELQQLVVDLTRESREMLSAITVLEEENRRLQAQLPEGANDGEAPLHTDER